MVASSNSAVNTTSPPSRATSAPNQRGSHTNTNNKHSHKSIYNPITSPSSKVAAARRSSPSTTNRPHIRAWPSSASQNPVTTTAAIAAAARLKHSPPSNADSAVTAVKDKREEEGSFRCTLGCGQVFRYNKLRNRHELKRCEHRLKLCPVSTCIHLFLDSIRGGSSSSSGSSIRGVVVIDTRLTLVWCSNNSSCATGRTKAAV